MFNEPLTVDQLAEKLLCSPYTIRERTRRGELPGIKFGDDWVFPPEALNQALTAAALEQAQARRQPAVVKAVQVKAAPHSRRSTVPAAWQG